MIDRMPSALTRNGPNARQTVNNNKLMAGYYGSRYQQQQALQQQQIHQQQNQNNNLNQNPRFQQPLNQQYQKHPQYQNRKMPNENNMDAILTCVVDDVYPMPEVVIFRRDFNGTNPYALKIFQIEVSSLINFKSK